MRAYCTGSKRRRRPPSSWAAAFFAAAADWASMRSMTASASVRSILPFKKARRVNSSLGLPGTGGKQGTEQFTQHHRRAVAVELGGVLPGVAVAATEADG